MPLQNDDAVVSPRVFEVALRRSDTSCGVLRVVSVEMQELLILDTAHVAPRERDWICRPAL